MSPKNPGSKIKGQGNLVLNDSYSANSENVLLVLGTGLMRSVFSP